MVYNRNILLYQVQCKMGKFMCRNTAACIPGNKKCDGTKDCSDGSDEFGCC